MNAKVLTNWQPSRLDAATIEREFLALCRQHGLRICGNRCEVRSPQRHYTHAQEHPDDPAYGWHQDTHGVPGTSLFDRVSDQITVMWSNVLPTEVARGHRRLRTRDGDVLLVDNLATKHRTPKGAELANRWFVRAHVHK